MNKLLPFAVFLAFLLISCSEDGPKHHDPKDPNSGISGSLYVTATSTTADFVGDKLNIQIESSDAWVASCPDTWCHISPSSGKGGKAEVAYAIIDANPTEQPRNTTITVKSGPKQNTVTLRQKAKPAIAISTNKITLNGNACSNTLVLKTNTEWEAECNASWLSFSPTTGSKGTTAITISASKNTSNQQREATLTISANGISADVIILQAAL